MVYVEVKRGDRGCDETRRIVDRPDQRPANWWDRSNEERNPKLDVLGETRLARPRCGICESLDTESEQEEVVWFITRRAFQVGHRTGR
jgi:hypothetical protein